MSENWFYAQNGQQIGPVTAEQIREAVGEGSLDHADLVWRDGMAQWTPIASIAELAGTVRAHGPATATLPRVTGLGYYTPRQHVEYVGFWIRFCAAFLDGLIVIVAGMVVGGVAGFFIGVTMAASGNADGIEMLAGVVGQILGIVVAWLYDALQTSSASQATLGKRAMGIVVTDEAGQRISFGRATGRFFSKYLSALILMIGYIMAAFTDRNRALHDMIAGTVVIKR